MARSVSRGKLTRLQQSSWVLAIALIASYVNGCSTKNGTNRTTTTPEAAGSCIDPVVLEGSSTLPDESTKQASDALSGEDPTCIGHKTPGADRVYRIVVPGNGNSKLSISVTPAQPPGPDAYDPVLYAAVECGARPLCLTGADARGGGSLESIEYLNASGQDQTIYVVVDGYGFQPGGGNFQLASELSAP